MGKGREHQEINVDDIMVDVVEEVARLTFAAHSLETLKKYFEQRQMMPYHTSRAFKNSGRKFHLIIWKVLVKLL